MISTREHIARGLYASWRFLRFDPEADKYLEVSGRGVLRSFWAMLFGIPIYTIFMLLVANDPGAANLVQIPFWLFPAGYVLVWPAFALFMFYVSPAIGVGHNFIRFMVAYNWARPIATCLQVPGNLIILAGVAGPVGSVSHYALLILNNGLALAFKTHVMHNTLRCPLVFAILLVAMDALLILLIEQSIVGAFASYPVAVSE